MKCNGGYLVQLLFVLLLLLAACTPGSPSDPSAGATKNIDQAQSINLAQQAKLTTATQVEIRRHDEKSGGYLPATTITDPAIVTALVNELDQPLPLQPALFCTAQYELIFQLADGKALTFNYGCVAEEGSYLQGGDTPLQDQAIEPPAGFQELLAPYVED